MAGCRSGRPVVGTSDACAAVPVIPVAPDSDMLSAAIADTENEVCLADSGDPESSERRRLYRRSAEPTDSVWINRLNGGDTCRAGSCDPCLYQIQSTCLRV